MAGRGQQTVLGMPSPFAAMPGGMPPAVSAFAAPPPPGPALAPAPAPVAAPPAPVAHKTMLGVALPGIAPTNAGVAAGPAPPLSPSLASAPGLAQAAPPAASAAPQPPRRNMNMTMPLQVAYVAPPAPLEALPAPPPPVVVKKRGVPLATVAMIIGGVVLVGGVTIALLYKGSPPMAAQARTTPDGADALHLTCDPKGCPDGTTVALGAATATFAGGQADLTLATPLHLGDNAFSLDVARPGMGRNETAKFVVPVAYRVRADVSTMSGPKPAITIRVEAKPGTDVKVDGKPVALDPNGAGAYAVDESAASEGPADESRVVSLDLKYAVTAAGAQAPESGTVSARVAIAPLRIDAPGAIVSVADDHVLLAGRGPKGATITVDGNAVTPGADGSFETTVALPSSGDHVIETRGGTAALTPRTVHVTVTRVASLAAAARAFEQQHPIGYDDAMADLTGQTGKPIVVEGPVLESRAAGHRTLVLVDDRRGCKKRPCHARVVVGSDLALAPNDVLHAYGTLARGFTATGGQTIPEVESQFALRTAK